MSAFHERKSEVLALLERLAALADNCGSRSVARTLRDETASRVQREEFHVVVVGEFNHGKTTLVNALLGEPLLPTGVTPTTALVHRIAYGTRRSLAVVDTEGQETPIAVERLRELSASAGDDQGAAASTREVRVTLPAPLLEDGIVLFDTPGVNELNAQRSEVAYARIPRADAVVVCLDAGQVLKRTEVEFLQEQVPSGTHERLWFVVNKIDVLQPQEATEALRYVHEQLSSILERPRIFPVSGQLALAGDDPRGGVAGFVTSLTESLGQDRGRALLDAALGHAQESERLLSAGMRAQRDALALDQTELARRMSILERELSENVASLEEREKAIRDSLGALKGTVETQLHRFRDRFADALTAEIEKAKPDDLRRYLPGFIEDNLRAAAAEQAREVTGRLQRLAEDTVAFVNEENQAQLGRLTDALGNPIGEVDLSVNTLPYDLGVFAVGATGLTVMVVSNVMVGGALLLASPVMAVLFRGRADQLLKTQAKEAAPDAVHQAVEKLERAFGESIDAFGDALIAFVAEARAQVLRSTHDVVTRVADAQREGSEAIAMLETENAEAVEALAAARQQLAALRKTLWDNPAPDADPEPVAPEVT